MNERNHLGQISITHQVDVIENGLRDIPMLAILDADGQIYSGAVLPNIDEELAGRVYRSMVYTRLLDERMVAAQRQGRISFYLASTGEEGAVVGSAAGLLPQDMIMSQYREQGALVFRGYRSDQFMNQLFSNRLDPNKGRQMPIHYGDKTLNFMTISSTLATQIPQAAGYAYGQKLAGKNAVTLCYFGEGAASEGDFHAGLNMAAVLKCPVIFFCRNNGYAISTPTTEQFAGDGIASRGIGYGVKTIRVDGNDPLAVLSATQTARSIAQATNQPVLIEAMTYRLAAHSTSDDPSGYRAKKEEENWRLKDPIARFKQWMLDKGWLDESDTMQFKQQTRDAILAALKTAEQVPAAPLRDIVSDVYADVPWHLAKQRDALISHVKQYPEHYPNTAGKS